MNFIVLTAQYTNAVLLAILPHFSDFAAKLRLAVPVPITSSAIQRVHYVSSGQVGDCVIYHTNGLIFYFSHSQVQGFESPGHFISRWHRGDPLPPSGGMDQTEQQAVAMAREALVSLGYPLDQLGADLPPAIEPPHTNDDWMSPNYRISWTDPLQSDLAIDVEVDASQKCLKRLTLLGPRFWHDPPMLDIPVVYEGSISPLTESSSNALMAVMLSRISYMATALSLPVGTSIRPSEVARIIPDTEDRYYVQLTNGYSFGYAAGDIRTVCSPSAVFLRYALPWRPMEDYLGKWVMSEAEAVQLARNTLREFGYYPLEFQSDLAPTVRRHEDAGRYVVPRYYVDWKNAPYGWLVSDAAVEINAENGTIESFALTKPEWWDEYRIAKAQRSVPDPFIFIPPKDPTLSTK